MSTRAFAFANDGSSHPSSNVLTGPITGGDRYNWAFDLRPNDIGRFEISVRKFNEMAEFSNLSLKPGHQTHPNGPPANHAASTYFDNGFYNQLFSRDLGENIRNGNIPMLPAALLRRGSSRNSSIRRAHLRRLRTTRIFILSTKPCRLSPRFRTPWKTMT